MEPTRPDWRLPPPGRRKPRTLWSDLAGLWRRFLALPAIARLVLGGIAVVVVIAVIALLSRSGSPTKVATRSTTTLPTLHLPLTTTSTIPAGDDKQVQSGIDGDSFQLTDGTKIRFIGIDAPDVETKACYSAQATGHLKDVLPANTMVRLVYDQKKTDQYGRTLAYVYRLPDGLFVNVALVHDGYAVQQSAPPDTVHDADIAAAQTDAKNAGRGLWSTCPSASSTTPTTSHTAATAPKTTSTTAKSTATTAATAPAATTSTAVSTTSTTTVQIVQEGTTCPTPGAVAKFPSGAAAVCTAELVPLGNYWEPPS